MNEITLRQMEEQINLQVGQIRRSLIKSLAKMGGYIEEDVMKVSRKIWMKTEMGNIIKSMLDNNGFLVNSEDWSKEVAFWLAGDENIEMTDAHWEVVNFLREYYEKYRIPPPMIKLIKAVGKKLGPEKGNQKYLYELFPGGPARQACKIAGLPRPHGHL